MAARRHGAAVAGRRGQRVGRRRAGGARAARGGARAGLRRVARGDRRGGAHLHRAARPPRRARAGAPRAQRRPGARPALGALARRGRPRARAVAALAGAAPLRAPRAGGGATAPGCASRWVADGGTRQLRPPRVRPRRPHGGQARRPRQPAPPHRRRPASGGCSPARSRACGSCSSGCSRPADVPCEGCPRATRSTTRPTAHRRRPGGQRAGRDRHAAPALRPLALARAPGRPGGHVGRRARQAPVPALRGRPGDPLAPAHDRLLARAGARARSAAARSMAGAPARRPHGHAAQRARCWS